MSKHTPGPWKAYIEFDWADVVPDVPPKPMGFARPHPLAVMNDYHGPDVMTANARLIAAAPDLLEACQGILEQADSPFADLQEWPNIQKVYDAVRKATGGDDE